MLSGQCFFFPVSRSAKTPKNFSEPILPEKFCKTSFFNCKQHFYENCQQVINNHHHSPEGIYLLHCTRKKNMQVRKVKSFKIYFSDFLISALDKSLYGYLYVKKQPFPDHASGFQDVQESGFVILPRLKKRLSAYIFSEPSRNYQTPRR